MTAHVAGNLEPGQDLEAPIRMLLVEDDVESAEALRTMLQRRGVILNVQSSGEEATAVFEPEAFDVVVADIRLKQLSGVDVLRHVRGLNKDFPVILMTGYDSMDSAIQAVRLGAQDYILKPLQSIEDLLTPVARAVRHYRLQQNHRHLQEVLQRTHEDLQQTHEDLRTLWAKHVAVVEDERRRVAREIHDTASQSVTALEMQIFACRGSLENMADPKPGAMLDECGRLARDIGVCLRDVLRDLRPPGLDALGLAGALEDYVAALSMRTGLDITLDLPMDERLPADVEIAFFRIAAEALQNTAKHAKACRVTVGLTRQNHEVCLHVADDGPGFNITEAPGNARRRGTGGWGLVGMRERAEAIGARFTVATGSGQGTRIELVWTRAEPAVPG